MHVLSFFFFSTDKCHIFEHRVEPHTVKQYTGELGLDTWAGAAQAFSHEVHSLFNTSNSLQGVHSRNSTVCLLIFLGKWSVHFPVKKLGGAGGAQYDTTLCCNRDVYCICALVMPEGSLSSYYHRPHICMLLLKHWALATDINPTPMSEFGGQCTAGGVLWTKGWRLVDVYRTASSESEDLCREKTDTITHCMLWYAIWSFYYLTEYQQVQSSK